MELLLLKARKVLSSLELETLFAFSRTERRPKARPEQYFLLLAAEEICGGARPNSDIGNDLFALSLIGMMQQRNTFQTLAKILAIYTLVVFSGLVLKSCPGCSPAGETMEVKICCGSDTGSCSTDCSSDISFVIKADTDLVPVLELDNFEHSLIGITVSTATNLNFQSADYSKAAFLAPLYFPEPDFRVLYQVFRC